MQQRLRQGRKYAVSPGIPGDSACCINLEFRINLELGGEASPWPGAMSAYGANRKREDARVAAAMWGGADALLARPHGRR
jgi:hypothetical protein